jgi:hypothetical protein
MSPVNWAMEALRIESTPVQVSGLSSVTAIAGGWLHSLFLKEDGTAWATDIISMVNWAIGTDTSRTTPVQVSGFDVSVTSHQWFIGGSSISGATTSTYTATTAGSYTVQVTNSNGCSATSATLAVAVNALPTPHSITAGGFHYLLQRRFGHFIYTRCRYHLSAVCIHCY